MDRSNNALRNLRAAYDSSGGRERSRDGGRYPTSTSRHDRSPSSRSRHRTSSPRRSPPRRRQSSRDRSPQRQHTHHSRSPARSHDRSHDRPRARSPWRRETSPNWLYGSPSRRSSRSRSRSPRRSKGRSRSRSGERSLRRYSREASSRGRPVSVTANVPPWSVEYPPTNPSTYYYQYTCSSSYMYDSNRAGSSSLSSSQSTGWPQSTSSVPASHYAMWPQSEPSTYGQSSYPSDQASSQSSYNTQSYGTDWSATSYDECSLNSSTTSTYTNYMPTAPNPPDTGYTGSQRVTDYSQNATVGSTAQSTIPNTPNTGYTGSQGATDSSQNAPAGLTGHAIPVIGRTPPHKPEPASELTPKQKSLLSEWEMIGDTTTSSRKLELDDKTQDNSVSSTKEEPSGCTLYLHGLDKINKMDLLLYFSKYGQIKNVEVEEEGQGHVEFNNMEQVKKAYADGLKLGYSGLSCHSIKDIMFMCNTSKRFQVAGNPYELQVSSLSADITEHDLRKYFSMVGTLIQVTIMPGGVGIIEFKSADHVDVAVNTGKATGERGVTTHWIKGKEVSCRSKCPKNCLLVSHLKTLTEQQLKQYFSKYGKVDNVTILQRVGPQGVSHGGFVSFESRDAVEGAYEEGLKWEKSEHHIKGICVECFSHVQGRNPCRLFVKDADKVSDMDIALYFSKYGAMKDCKITHGCGYLEFSSPEHVEAAYKDGLTHKSHHCVEQIVINCKPYLKDIDETPLTPARHEPPTIAVAPNPRMTKSSSISTKFTNPWLYIGGMRGGKEGKQIMEYFKQYGATKFDLNHDVCYGNLRFNTIAGAEAAYMAGEPMQINNSRRCHKFDFGQVWLARENCKKLGHFEGHHDPDKISVITEAVYNYSGVPQRVTKKNEKIQFGVSALFIQYHFSQFGIFKKVSGPYNWSKPVFVVEYQTAAEAQYAFAAGKVSSCGTVSKHEIGSNGVIFIRFKGTEVGKSGRQDINDFVKELEVITGNRQRSPESPRRSRTFRSPKIWASPHQPYLQHIEESPVTPSMHEPLTETVAPERHEPPAKAVAPVPVAPKPATKSSSISTKSNTWLYIGGMRGGKEGNQIMAYFKQYGVTGFDQDNEPSYGNLKFSTALGAEAAYMAGEPMQSDESRRCHMFEFGQVWLAREKSEKRGHFEGNHDFDKRSVITEAVYSYRNPQQVTKKKVQYHFSQFGIFDKIDESGHKWTKPVFAVQYQTVAEAQYAFTAGKVSSCGTVSKHVIGKCGVVFVKIKGTDVGKSGRQDIDDFVRELEVISGKRQRSPESPKPWSLSPKRSRTSQSPKRRRGSSPSRRDSFPSRTTSPTRRRSRSPQRRSRSPRRRSRSPTEMQQTESSPPWTSSSVSKQPPPSKTLSTTQKEPSPPWTISTPEEDPPPPGTESPTTKLQIPLLGNLTAEQRKYPPTATKLYLDNVSKYTHIELMSYFSRYGTIERLDLRRDRHSVKGFVHYTLAASARTAYQAGALDHSGKQGYRFHKMDPFRRDVRVRYLIDGMKQGEDDNQANVGEASGSTAAKATTAGSEAQKEELPTIKKLYLPNVHKHTRKELKTYFSRFGAIYRAIGLQRNRCSHHLQGFVYYTLAASAKRAYEAGAIDHIGTQGYRIHKINSLKPEVKVGYWTGRMKQGEDDNQANVDEASIEAKTSTTAGSEVQEEESLEARKLLVYNNLQFPQEVLRHYFRKFGIIQEITQRRKFACVYFESPTDAKRAFLAGICKGNCQRHHIGQGYVDVAYLKNGKPEKRKQEGSKGQSTKQPTQKQQTPAAVADSRQEDKQSSTTAAADQQEDGQQLKASATAVAAIKQEVPEQAGPSVQRSIKGQTTTLVLGDGVSFNAGKPRTQLAGGGTVVWDAVDGSRVSNLCDRITPYMEQGVHPTTVVIALGAYDTFYNRFKEEFTAVRNLLPTARLIWSSILPRRKYENEDRPGGGKKHSQIINRIALEELLKISNTRAIKISHQIFSTSSPSNLFEDDIHLSDNGQRLFEQNVLDALSFFNCSPTASCFPQKDSIMSPTLVLGDGVTFNVGKPRTQLADGGGTIVWDAVDGSRVSNLCDRITAYTEQGVHPAAVVIALGAYDIFYEKRPVKRLRAEFTAVRNLLPTAHLIWSDILPRRKYENEEIPGAGKRCLTQITQGAKNKLKELSNSHVIETSHIFQPNRSNLFEDDIHLSDKGQRVFEQHVQNALSFFNRSPATFSFPQMGGKKLSMNSAKRQRSKIVQKRRFRRQQKEVRRNKKL